MPTILEARKRNGGKWRRFPFLENFHLNAKGACQRWTWGVRLNLACNDGMSHVFDKKNRPVQICDLFPRWMIHFSRFFISGNFSVSGFMEIQEKIVGTMW